VAKSKFDYKNWENVLRAFVFGLLCFMSFGFIGIGLWMRQYGDIEVSLVAWYIPAALGSIALKASILSYVVFGDWNSKRGKKHGKKTS